MIVKLQRDLDDPHGPMLVYNQSRSYLTIVPPSVVLYEKLAGRLKIYVQADVIDGKLRFGEKVADQNW